MDLYLLALAVHQTRQRIPNFVFMNFDYFLSLLSTCEVNEVLGIKIGFWFVDLQNLV